ncbi:hypothetical protein MKX01_026179 [Papaver californicum]|nr:hypothetical protein MKX01_026179 [Papaver californicum]
MKDKSLLSYGVSFSQQSGSSLSNLDSVLTEHSCFSGFSSSRLSNAYTKQVQKGGAMIITEAAEEKKGNLRMENKSNKKTTNGTKKSGLNKGLKRVRTVSKMTEKLSKTVLNTVGYATGSVMGPIV